MKLPATSASPANPVLLRLVPVTVLAGLAAIGLLARFIGLGLESFWVDELIQMSASDPSLSVRSIAFEISPKDANPPLYHAILWAWRNLVPESETTVRLPSALFGTAAVLVALFPGRRVIGRESGLYFAAFLACSYGAILFSQEARPYSLLILLSTCLVIAFFHVSRRLGNGKCSRLDLAAFWALSLAASLTHYFGMLLVGALFGCLFAVGVILRRCIGGILLASLAWLGIAVGWLVYEIPRKLSIVDHPWMPNDLDWYFSQFVFFMHLAFGSLISSKFLFLGLIVLAAVMCLRHFKCAPFGYSISPPFLLIVACVITVVTALGLSQITPLMHRRYFIVLLPPLYAIVGLALASPTTRMGERLRVWVAVILAAAMLWPALNRIDFEKAEWRESAQFVQRQPGCSQAVVPVWTSNYWGTEEYDYYMTGEDRPRLVPVRDSVAAKAVHNGGACRVLLWAAHVWHPNQFAHASQLLPHLQINGRPIQLISFPGTYVLLGSRVSSEIDSKMPWQASAEPK